MTSDMCSGPSVRERRECAACAEVRGTANGSARKKQAGWNGTRRTGRHPTLPPPALLHILPVWRALRARAARGGCVGQSRPGTSGERHEAIDGARPRSCGGPNRKRMPRALSVCQTHGCTPRTTAADVGLRPCSARPQLADTDVASVRCPCRHWMPKSHTRGRDWRF